MAINQISTANTFEQWLVATQSLIAFANSITNAAPGSTFTANTNEYVITGNLSVGNTVTAVTVNTDVIIFDDGTRLASNVQIVNAYAHSNGAFNHANGAFSKANSANVLAQAAFDFANTIVANGNVVVANTITGNNLVANVLITTPNITVTSNVTTGNIVVSNNITVTNNISSNNITVTNNISSGNVTVTNNISSNNITVTNNISSGNINVSNQIITTNITATLVTAIDINTTSDVALKDNLTPIVNPLFILDRIDGLSFNWKFDGSKSYGLLAQQVEQILPEIVKTRDDGFKGINYLNLIAFLIEAIKQLNKDLNQVKDNIEKMPSSKRSEDGN